MLEDIEELILPEKTERISSTNVSRKVFKASGRKEQQLAPNALGDYFLPGQASIFVKTWGCGHNNSDGEYMAGLLAAQGYEVLVEDIRKGEAAIWILNSCTVKGPSELSFFNEVKKGKACGKTVIVAGCVPQGTSKSSTTEFDDLSVIGVQQIDRVVEVVEETLKGNVVKLTREKKDEVAEGRKRKAGGAPLDLPKVRRNPLVEIIPINTGCLNQCTYCKTKHARGDLGSYTPEEIWRRVSSVANEGVKEIWLTSEDTGAYGRDIGTNIVELLWGIVRILEKFSDDGPMLRVGMTNPPYILEHLDEITKILSHAKVFSFLHVPVQCGSDKVLDDMRRQYSVDDFRKVVNTLRGGVPSCTIATDIICGFPTESEEDFEETMSLLREFKFSVLHISQFYPRPGTPAALLPRLPSQTIKARSRIVSAFFNSYTTYDELMGTMLKVLVTEISSDGLFYVGHDKSYRQVLVPLNSNLLGKFITVKVVRTGKFFVEGEPVDPKDLEKGDPSPNSDVPRYVNLGGKVVNLVPRTASNRHGISGMLSSYGWSLQTVALTIGVSALALLVVRALKK
ncbi:Threonylcarbamoyladenosine tRNA methylthiotransferase [Dinochytrium kinnereticum]|nr:Threonylcarbamoyladenosine tRNA methylthiotransferase [Dinochytrium kinnereticum]